MDDDTTSMWVAAPLTKAYSDVLARMRALATLRARGNFALVFHLRTSPTTTIVVKVPRSTPSQRMCICVNPTTSSSNQRQQPYGQYLYLTVRDYFEREARFLAEASACLPRLFCINNNLPSAPLPLFETLEKEGHRVPPYVMMNSAIMTLRDVWLMHKKGLCTLSRCTVMSIIQQLLLQLALLHDGGIAHGDLRLANVLVFLSPNTLSDVLFHLDAFTQHYTGISSNHSVLIHFRRGFLGLYKLADYGNAHYVNRRDTAAHRREYDALEKVLFQDLDTVHYDSSRRFFHHLRDQLLHTKLGYPKFVQYIKTNTKM